MQTFPLYSVYRLNKVFHFINNEICLTIIIYVRYFTVLTKALNSFPPKLNIRVWKKCR